MGTYLPRKKSLLYGTWINEALRCVSVQKSGYRTRGCLPPTPTDTTGKKGKTDKLAATSTKKDKESD
jgi:hypothetical protein